MKCELQHSGKKTFGHIHHLHHISSNSQQLCHVNSCREFFFWKHVALVYLYFQHEWRWSARHVTYLQCDTAKPLRPEPTFLRNNKMNCSSILLSTLLTYVHLILQTLDARTKNKKTTTQIHKENILQSHYFSFGCWCLFDVIINSWEHVDILNNMKYSFENRNGKYSSMKNGKVWTSKY